MYFCMLTLTGNVMSCKVQLFLWEVRKHYLKMDIWLKVGLQSEFSNMLINLRSNVPRSHYRFVSNILTKTAFLQKKRYISRLRNSPLIDETILIQLWKYAVYDLEIWYERIIPFRTISREITSSTIWGGLLSWFDTTEHPPYVHAIKPSYSAKS